MPNVYTVGQLNSFIKQLIAQDPMLGLVYVKGEISNLVKHKSGHIYFTLKDETGAISSAIFKFNAVKLNFSLEEGMEVECKGKVDFYEPTGKITFIATDMKKQGVGALAEKFEALKKELAERGMFSEEYKLPIPSFPKKLGVVTAPTGAAVRDIISVSKRRYPGIEIILYPALVQGEGAAQSIIKGIQTMEKYGVDLMIVGRGGGSYEDLFCFNDEKLAEAIFNCSIPIISAVGHEIDYTIADFVADKRAATPSAAAELAIPDVTGLIMKISTFEDAIERSFSRVFSEKKAEIKNLALRLEAVSPERKLNEKKAYVERAKSRLNDIMTRRLSEKKYACDLYRSRMGNVSPERRIAESKKHVDDLQKHISLLMDRKITDNKHKLNISATKLKGLSPLDKLCQGYSYVSDNDGKTVNSIEKVNAGDKISIFVKDGLIDAVVENKKYISRQ